jgi:bifunctional non-homologous end joining protein LigD
MPLLHIQPIIPTLRKQPFDHAACLFDVKYDGFRALCHIERGRCLLISRNGKPLSRFASLGAELAYGIEIEDAVFEGEVIVTDETGRPQFYELLRRTGAPAYVAFDLLCATALICARYP